MDWGRPNFIAFVTQQMRLAWSIVVVLAAVFAARQFLPWDSSETRESLFLQTSLSLLDHAESNAIRFHDVAVGYNTNADLVADAVSVLKKLGHDKPPRKEDRVPVDKVSQLSDFTSLVSYFMTQGSAAERIIVDRQVCGTIATAARDIGGTIFHKLLHTFVTYRLLTFDCIFRSRTYRRKCCTDRYEDGRAH